MLGEVVLRIAVPWDKFAKSREVTRQAVMVIVLVAMPALLPSIANAQPADCLPRAPVTGINTSRIPGKSLGKWCSIERLALSVNETGQPRYPLLAYLLGWAETSGHVVYIELPEVGNYHSTAGSFNIEQFDPLGIKQVIVIRLFLGSIDRAYVGPSTRRADGLIPFSDLNKVERYAEVLGHELAHAYEILEDFELTKKVEELVQQTNRLFLSFRSRFRYLPMDPELERRMVQKDAFLEELETSAMAFEKTIWQELRNKGRQLAQER